MDRKRPTGRLLPILCLAAVSGAVSAVEVFPEQKPASVAQETPLSAPQAASQRLTAVLGQRPETSVATAELTATDQEAIARDNQQAPKGRPLKIGVVKPLAVGVDLQPLDVAAMGDQTYSFQGGLVRSAAGVLSMAIRIDTLGTNGTRLRFDDVKLPANAQLYILNEANETFGPYSGNRASFWTQTITGAHFYVQVVVPNAESDNASFKIGAALLFDPKSDIFCPANAPCIEDGSCHTAAEWPEIDKVRKAIAHINFIQDGSSYLCSGGLLADTDSSTNIPYFLTADHCLNDPEVATTVETWFNYQTPQCNTGCPPTHPLTSSTLGATLLQHSSVDDHSLLVLDQAPPPEAWYLGWNSAPVANLDGTVLFRLSHPLGSPQAFSAQRIDTAVNPSEFCGTTTMPRGPFIFSRNFIGATEGGSSGSPVAQANGQVVGQLFGICGYNVGDVCDAASNTTVDGAFANYFPDVAPWLNPNPLQLPLTVQRLGSGEGRVLSSLEADPLTAGQSAGAAQPMLLGSAPVEQTDWPWQAALEISTWRINGKWNCGGSVIHPNWILTAAHCIVDAIDDRFTTVAPASIKVRTGSTRFEYGGQESKVKRIVKHPEFNPLTLEHDIALLELKSPVYVDPVRPVTWEREPKLACLGTAGNVTGWTDMELCGIPANVLSKVSATIVDPERCRSVHGADKITSEMLCTDSAAENAEECQLDDGSPLVVSNGRGGYEQAGIVSWGNGCDSQSAPTVHTRLATHVAWMESMTGLDLSSAAGANVIDCGSTCNALFAKDTLVTLTASASPGSTFNGWEGACSGNEASCQVTMTQALNVRALFNAVRPSTQSCASATP